MCHTYLMVTFDCHSSLSIGFSHMQTYANYHNYCTVTSNFLTTIMAITCWLTATKYWGLLLLIIKEWEQKMYRATPTPKNALPTLVENLTFIIYFPSVIVSFQFDFITISNIVLIFYFILLKRHFENKLFWSFANLWMKTYNSTTVCQFCEIQGKYADYI